MATDKQIKELMQLASESRKYSELERQLLSEVKVPSSDRIKPNYRKEPTWEERERFYKKLNTPYGL